MGRAAQGKIESASVRRTRVRAVVAKAKTAGETIPPGVKLIGFREPTAKERAYGEKLVPAARRVLARRTRAAA